jgi:activator of HSP90 ATPase
MATILVSRRAIALGLAALPAGMTMPLPVWGAPSAAENSTAPEVDGLTRTSEAIHQEITLKADRRAVYEALTNSRQFDAITRLSDALALVTAPNAKPTSISPEVGGSFTLFGGYITGRTLEMVRDERLVQAWRTGSWIAGDYSIVKFVLVANGPETRVVFDHRGFPDGAGEHLATGWHTHYWQPLARFLSEG